MLSRVADSLYWMSRYFERADHCARVLEANYNLMLNPSKTSTEERWQRIMASLGIAATAEGVDPQTAMIQLTTDPGHASSIVSCIAGCRENAGQVREQISSEMWERLNRLYHHVTQANRPEGDFDPLRLVAAVREGSYEFQGATAATMSHGEGWHFIQVGRYLERATATAILLEAYHEDLWADPDRTPEGNEYLEWMGLLRSATAFEAYCKVYTADLTPERILEFLLLDPEFPHSLRFSIDSLNNALQAIQSDAGGNRAEELQRISGRLAASLGYASVDEILSGDIVAYLRNIQRQCQAIHETIYHLYVDYSIQAALAG